MSNETVESLMNDLIQLDIDASHAYSQALGVIKEKEFIFRLYLPLPPESFDLETRLNDL